MYILGDETPDDDARFLSEWRNADQDENQGSSEASFVQVVQEVYAKEEKISLHVPLSAVVSKVISSSLVRYKATDISNAAKFIADFGGPRSEYLREWHEMHSFTVNPKELTVSLSWMADLHSSIPKECPILKLAICWFQWSGESVCAQTRPLPDISRCVTCAELNALSQDKPKCTQINGFLRTTRELIEPLLSGAGLAPREMRLNMRSFEQQIARLSLSKKLHKEFETGVTGKFTEAKMVSVRARWLRSLQIKYVALKDIGAMSGINLEAADEEAAKEEVQS